MKLLYLDLKWHFLICSFVEFWAVLGLVGRALDLRPEGPGSRLVTDQRPPCTLMAPGACKIRRGCNVLQVPCQKYLWGYLGKVMASPLVQGSKLRDQLSPDQPTGWLPNCPTLNTSHPSIHLLILGNIRKFITRTLLNNIFYTGFL